jgi:steroid 5-alpha reductase family enzyme
VVERRITDKETIQVGFWGILAAEAVWLALAMTGAWALQRATRNCGWVDAVWSGATGLGAAAAALMPAPGADGPAHRGWLAAAMVAGWGFRLAMHIARRTPGAAEDPRYAEFRKDWGTSFEGKLFGFLMIQAACAWVLVAAALLAARNPAPLRVQDALGLLLLIGAVYGESEADSQLAAYRRRTKGGICDTGLWAYSRHPNYFFEFLVWCAYPLLAIDFSGAYPQGFFTVAGPALMFWLLRFASGVPTLEKSMLARRGDAFRAYQARVSAFFPWPPKRISS